MASTLEKFAALYGKPEQPAPAAATPASALGGVSAAPPLSQTDRVAATYAHRPAAPQRSIAPTSPARAEQERVARDALRDRTTLTQRMAATYNGPNSYTIPQSFQLAEYR